MWQHFGISLFHLLSLLGVGDKKLILFHIDIFEDVNILVFLSSHLLLLLGVSIVVVV
ncbi:11229_t:CDS:2, partial [Dentiscutata erythropus]